MPGLINFFQRRNFDFRLFVHVADVEAFDRLILTRSGETESSFLRKTIGTRQEIKNRVAACGLGNLVITGSMIDFYTNQGITDYPGLKENIKTQIALSQAKKVRRTVAALKQERSVYGPDGVVDELTDYAAYGQVVGGRAVIVSPDAMSAVPAYNFLREARTQAFNPTILLKG